VANICRGCRDPGIDLHNLKRRHQLLQLRSAMKRFPGKHLRPDYPAHPVPTVTRKLLDGGRSIEQPINDNIRVEERV
jgi:hypothetical protein